MLRIDGLYCNAGGRSVVRGITTDFEAGQLHVILGPNGSGKSTFLKAFSGEWPLAAGSVCYDDQPLGAADKTKLARRRAVMSQLPELHFPVRVDDIVMMGRYPHFSFRPTAHDRDIVGQAMQRLNVSPLAARDYLSLSGGERQRVQFARALAQIWDPPPAGNRYLFLDEPVSSLDIHYQHEFLALTRSLTASGVIIVAVLHDLNLALQYADRLLFLKDGQLAAAGTAPAIATPAIIREVFGMEAHLLDNPWGRSPVVVYR